MKLLLLTLLVLVASGCWSPRQESVKIRFSGDTEHGVTEVELIPAK